MAAKMNLLAQRSSYGAESGKGYVFLTQDRKLDSTQKFTAAASPPHLALNFLKTVKKGCYIGIIFFPYHGFISKSKTNISEEPDTRISRPPRAQGVSET